MAVRATTGMFPGNTNHKKTLPERVWPSKAHGKRALAIQNDENAWWCAALRRLSAGRAEKIAVLQFLPRHVCDLDLELSRSCITRSPKVRASMPKGMLPTASTT